MLGAEVSDGAVPDADLLDAVAINDCAVLGADVSDAEVSDNAVPDADLLDAVAINDGADIAAESLAIEE